MVSCHRPHARLVLIRKNGSGGRAPPRGGALRVRKAAMLAWTWSRRGCPAMWATRRRAPPRSEPVVAAIDRSSRGWTVCPAAPCSGDAPERESGPTGLSDLREGPRSASLGVGPSAADDGQDVQASGMRRWPLTCSVPSASHAVIVTKSTDLRRTGSTASARPTRRVVFAGRSSVLVDEWGTSAGTLADGVLDAGMDEPRACDRGQRRLLQSEVGGRGLPRWPCSRRSSKAGVRRPSARVPADCCGHGEAIVRPCRRARGNLDATSSTHTFPRVG
jgi:hypothetical protein